MRSLNRKVELAYMLKVLSQAPQYLAYAIGVCAIALATAIGGLDEKSPTPIAKATVPAATLASAHSTGTHVASVTRR
jgi:hypothetical protein